MPDTVDMAYKFRLYPDEEQQQLIAKNFGCCRWVYNHFLWEREHAWEKTQKQLSKPKIVPGTEDDDRPEYVKDEDGKTVYELADNESYDPEAKNLTMYDTSKMLTQVKKETLDDEGRAWLKDADSTALVYELRNLDAAYQSFFKGLKRRNNDLAKGIKRDLSSYPGKPVYKRKSDRDSYKISGQAVKVSYRENRVKLAKLGWVKCKVHRIPAGRIVSATVSRSSSGRYYVSLQCDGAPAPAQTPAGAPATGVEVGVEHAAVTSDGTVYDTTKREKLERRLKHEQKMISKCQGYKKGQKKSKRFIKRQQRIGRLNERIADAKRAEMNQISHDIASNYGEVYMRKTEWGQIRKKKEDKRDVPRFIEQAQHRRLAQASPFELQRQIVYKTQWRGGSAFMLDGNVASTQTCSVCGYKNEALAGQKGLSQREWTCPKCGTHHQRDVNSASYLLKEGTSRREAGKLEAEPMPEKKARGKKKTAHAAAEDAA